MSLDDWNGQLDEVIPAKSPVKLDEGVLKRKLIVRMQLNYCNGLAI